MKSRYNMAIPKDRLYTGVIDAVDACSSCNYSGEAFRLFHELEEYDDAIYCLWAECPECGHGTLSEC